MTIYLDFFFLFLELNILKPETSYAILSSIINFQFELSRFSRTIFDNIETTVTSNVREGEG